MAETLDIFLELNEVIHGTKFKSLNFLELLTNIEFIDRNKIPTDSGIKIGIVNIQGNLMFSLNFRKAFIITYDIARRYSTFSSKVQKNNLYCQNFLCVFNLIHRLLSNMYIDDNPLLSNEELDTILFKEDFKNKEMSVLKKKEHVQALMESIKP